MDKSLSLSLCKKTQSKSFEILTFESRTETDTLHSHPCFTLCYCQRGSFTHYTGDESAVLSHGDLFIVPPGVNHALKINVAQTVIYQLLFPLEFVMSDMRGKQAYQIFLKDLLLGKNIYPKLAIAPDEIVFAECILAKIMKEEADRKEESDEIIRHCIASLLTVMSRICNRISADESREYKNKEQFIDYCVSYVDAHCTEDISLDEITKVSAMSKSVFCMLFKEKTGLSFKDYLNRKRIQKAMALIKNGEKTMNVASICGYREFSTFYRNFNKFTSTTPGNYQKSVRQNKK